MAKTSLLKGTFWRWREGRKYVPMKKPVCGFNPMWRIETRELCTDIPDNNNVLAEKIKEELTSAHITVGKKTTHSHIDGGRLIVFAAISYQEEGEEKNMEKLKGYIRSHGGEIIGDDTQTKEQKKSDSIGNFFQNLLFWKKKVR